MMWFFIFFILLVAQLLLRTDAIPSSSLFRRTALYNQVKGPKINGLLCWNITKQNCNKIIRKVNKHNFVKYQPKETKLGRESIRRMSLRRFDQRNERKYQAASRN